ncbi:MAG: sulfatase-like hydrolase/transferase [Acidobacteriota bacterium]|nr:LTA synthase family protein [Blastocatellia bacterium]MDW8240862.1 sulfatase-like hydrolase/transferase [Acidobacteriota bacterium]
MTAQKSKGSPVVHPFLLAFFPVLSLYSSNLGRVGLDQLLLPMLVAGGFVFLLERSFRWLMNERHKAGLWASVVWIMIIAYGPTFDLAQVLWSVSPLLNVTFRYMAIWVIPFIGVAWWITRTKARAEQFTSLFNLVAGALVLMPLLSIISYSVTARAARPAAEGKGISAWAKVEPELTISRLPAEQQSTSSARTPADQPALPDVYYIILDRYASADVLREAYGFDNRPFLSWLEQRGFYVVAQARSNYPKTAHSLASSLNMMFLDDVREQYGDQSNDWTPLYQRVRDYKLWRFFKAKGYQFIHVGSWWHPTSENPHADVNINLYSLPEFSRVLYQMTLFYPFSVKTGVLDERSEQWRRTRYQFARLADVPAIKQPTFVFAHFLVPHPPYVFARDGRFLSLSEVAARTRTQNYTEQLAYTNHLLQQLVDQLLSRSETPPIIILQADEGPFPLRYERQEATFDWTKATDEELREKMGILNAYYLPDVDATGKNPKPQIRNPKRFGFRAPDFGFPTNRANALYPEITPVNSFRVVLSAYFGATLPQLPDRSYAFVDHQHLYKFFDVTARLRSSAQR